MDPTPPPAPRAIPSWSKISSFGSLFALLFGGIWLVTGGLIAGVFVAVGGPPWIDRALDQRGVVARAEVQSATPTSSRINGTRVVELSLAFRDREGNPQHAVTSTHDRLTIAAAEGGRAVDIEYDPDRPSLVRVVGGTASIFGWFTLMPLGFAGVGAVVFGAGVRQMRRRRRIYRDGVAATAVVTAVHATLSRVNRRPVKRVEYQFQALAGTTRGSYTTTTPPEPGSQLWVLYDPADAARSVPA